MPINLSSVTPGIPSGTTAQRPAAPAVGDLYYNTDEAFLQVYDKGAWYFYGIAAKDVTVISAVNQGTGRAYNDGQMQVSYTPDTTGGVAKTTTIWSDPQQLSIVATGSPVTFTGLTSGVSHRFYAVMANKAVAANQGGELISTGVIATTVPQAPQSLIATAADSSASIAFSGGTGGSAITNYSYSIDGTNYTAFSPAQTSSPVTITGLTNGQAYTIYLKATNINGTSLASSGVSVTPGVSNSFESIATTTVGAGGSSTITFNSIPSTFKHLQLRHIARTTNASTNGNMFIRLNGDTGSNYAWHRFEAYGNGISSTGQSSQSAFGVGGLMTGAQSITSAYGTGILDILDYTNTNKHKTIKTLTGYENNANGAAGNDQGYLNLNSSLWFKAGSGVTNDAVNSITITINGGGNFAQHSQFALYGIRGE